MPRLLKRMTLFKKKYRVETARRPGWDYSLPGWYLVTICTMLKKPYLGRVIDEAVDLFSIGKYAQKCWLEIPSHYKNVVLDEFIVMPNHIHGILVIPREPVRKHDSGGVEGESKQVSRSLGSIVGSFKSAVTRWCWQEQMEFDWQPRFHDRIIRDEKSLAAIRAYIRDNPMNWGKDPDFI
jgi:putative transposase